MNRTLWNSCLYCRNIRYCVVHLNKLLMTSQIVFHQIKALCYSCTLAPPCTWAISLLIVYIIMWMLRQCKLPIVTSQWLFIVTSLHHCYAPHFMNGQWHLHLENNILYVAHLSKTTGWWYSTLIEFVSWIIFV